MVVGSNLSLFLVSGGEVVHGRGFESLILGVNGGDGGECMVEGSNLGPSRPPGLLFLNISLKKRALKIELPEIKIEIDGPMKIQMASGFI
jgi:hypothetical protein